MIHHHRSSFISMHHLRTYVRTYHYSSSCIIMHHPSSFITITYSSSFIMHHPSSSIIIHHHSFIIYHHSSSSIIHHTYARTYVIHHDSSSSSSIIHHHASSIIIPHHSSCIIHHFHHHSSCIIHHYSSSFIMHDPSLSIRRLVAPCKRGPADFREVQNSTIRTYVRPPPRQEHEENHRDWLARFVKEEWGSSTDRKENDRLKALCKRCRQIFLQEEKIVAELRVGPGRGRQGFRSSRTLLDQRKRKKGGGRKITCPELGYELFQWTVDTINNLKSRLFGWMLTEQARIIKQDIETYCEAHGVPCKLPVVGSGFLHRWRLEWGITQRAVTIVYKVPWKDVVTRVGIGLRNNIRVRVLWERMFPGVPFRVITFDQKPVWFNSNGCSDIHWRRKGVGSGVFRKENKAPVRIRTYVRIK